MQSNHNHIIIEVSRDEHFKSPFLRELIENWPAIAKDYRHYCHLSNPQKGDVWTWTSPEGQKFFHLITEDEPGQKPQDSDRSHYFKVAFKKVKKILESEKISNLAIPIGGLHIKYDEIKNIVSEVLDTAPVQITYN